MIAKLLSEKMKPTRGFSHLLHVLLVASLPLALFIFVRLEFFAFAFILLLMSKWRMFAVRTRYWLANIRLNFVDIVFGAGIIISMMSAQSMVMQLIWAGIYLVWLLYIKPASSKIMVALQAVMAQTLFLGAFLERYSHYNSAIIVVVFWVTAYFCARHFLAGFDEDKPGLLASVWALFVAELGWLSSHWLVFFGVAAQPVVLLASISVGMTSLYYLDKDDKLSVFAQKQIMASTFVLIIIIIALSDWGDKAV